MLHIRRRTIAAAALIVALYLALLAVMPPPEGPVNARGMPCALPMAGCFHPSR